jgi:hypothetical protein
LLIGRHFLFKREGVGSGGGGKTPQADRRWMLYERRDVDRSVNFRDFWNAE